MNKTKHEKKRKKLVHLAEALHLVVGEIHGFWTWIPLSWLQLLLLSLIVGFGEGCKCLGLG